jgi:hypothetical protein
MLMVDKLTLDKLTWDFEGDQGRSLLHGIIWTNHSSVFEAAALFLFVLGNFGINKGDLGPRMMKIKSSS